MAMTGRIIALVCAALVTVVALTACGPTDRDRTGTTGTVPRGPLLVSLGDSYAAGYRPSTDEHAAGQSTDAFVYPLARARGLSVVNFGCSGITAWDFEHGQPCQRGARAVAMPDLAADSPTARTVLTLLKAHRTRVKLVTIVLGANDINACGTRTDWRSCAGQAVRRAEPALSALVASVRKAVGPNVRIVGLDYVNVWKNSALWGKRAAVVFEKLLDPMLRRVYVAHGATFVDVTAAGLDPCTMTYFCAVGDIHPTAAGHQRIADLVEAALTSRGSNA